MTPAEKAQALYDKMENSIFIEPESTWEGQCKQCALISVNEIIDAIDWHEYETPNKELNYWLDVRKEIELL